jgi:hypothetical protein
MREGRIEMEEVPRALMKAKRAAFDGSGGVSHVRTSHAFKIVSRRG